MSRYRGLKVVLTMSHTGSWGFLSISAKGTSHGWDEWSSLIPAVRVSGDSPPGSSREALELILSGVTQALEELDRA